MLEMIRPRSAVYSSSDRAPLARRFSISCSRCDFVGAADESRLFVDRHTVLDVSGASTTLSVERNSLRVELRGSQVQDSPLQRDGALRGKTVYIDIRKHGTRADGSTWQGTPLADVSGNISAIHRTQDRFV